MDRMIYRKRKYTSTLSEALVRRKGGVIYRLEKEKAKTGNKEGKS
jgi:hypothetical protein